jgi:hypothetical protein
MTVFEAAETFAACTLPTADRPFRLGEWDALLGTDLLHQERLPGATLRWTFHQEATAEVWDLARREQLCCSFFTFAFTAAADGLRLEVSVPESRTDVLDALAARGERRRP